MPSPGGVSELSLIAGYSRASMPTPSDMQLKEAAGEPSPLAIDELRVERIDVAVHRKFSHRRRLVDHCARRQIDRGQLQGHLVAFRSLGNGGAFECAEIRCRSSVRDRNGAGGVYRNG